MLPMILYSLGADAEPDSFHEKNITDVFFVAQDFINGSLAPGLFTAGGWNAVLQKKVMNLIDARPLQISVIYDPDSASF